MGQRRHDETTGSATGEEGEPPASFVSSVSSDESRAARERKAARATEEGAWPSVVLWDEIAAPETSSNAKTREPITVPGGAPSESRTLN